MGLTSKSSLSLHVLETPTEMEAVEELERLIWPGSETDVIPSHLLLAAVHGGGLVVGAYDETLDPPLPVGFVFGFPGVYYTPDGPRIKHCSHQLGVSLLIVILASVSDSNALSGRWFAIKE